VHIMAGSLALFEHARNLAIPQTSTSNLNLKP
jgi:hypothetical protein